MRDQGIIVPKDRELAGIQRYVRPGHCTEFPSWLGPCGRWSRNHTRFIPDGAGYCVALLQAPAWWEDSGHSPGAGNIRDGTSRGFLSLYPGPGILPARLPFPNGRGFPGIMIPYLTRAENRGPPWCRMDGYAGGDIVPGGQGCGTG